MKANQDSQRTLVIDNEKIKMRSNQDNLDTEEI